MCILVFESTRYNEHFLNCLATQSIMGSGTFSTDIAKINNFAQAAIKAKEKDIPGLVFQCVNGSGDVLASAVTGVRDTANSIPMTNDTVFWIASCTKLVTSIACMQLVECGKAELDNPDLIATVLPEVAQAKVLVYGEEKEQERNITLRMLLTHTCKSIFLSARYPGPYLLWRR
jgi:CubicO group peptidase (beta-lactamase class C family)